MPFSTDLPTPPAPLVPPDTDVSVLAGFMLNVDHLLASELVAIGTPEECWAALMLWCRAWKQIPAGSLPNDERVLASFSGAGRRWPKVREVALRGFVRCTDGRLYHRFLCAEVQRANAKHLAFKNKRDQDRERLAQWRQDRRVGENTWAEIRQRVFERDGYQCTKCGSTDDLHCDHIVEARDGGSSEMHNLTTLCRSCHSSKTALRRRREMHFVAEETGRDVERKKEPNGSSFPSLPIDPNGSISLTADAARNRKLLIKKDFEDFWGVYPRKVGKKAARLKYDIARRGASADEILDAARRYANSVIGTAPEYVAHPTTWLNQGRWQDEEASSAPMHDYPTEPPPPLDEMWKDC